MKHKLLMIALLVTMIVELAAIGAMLPVPAATLTKTQAENAEHVMWQITRMAEMRALSAAAHK